MSCPEEQRPHSLDYAACQFVWPLSSVMRQSRSEGAWPWHVRVQVKCLACSGRQNRYRPDCPYCLLSQISANLSIRALCMSAAIRYKHWDTPRIYMNAAAFALWIQTLDCDSYDLSHSGSASKRSTCTLVGSAPIINVHLMPTKLECNHSKRIQNTEIINSLVCWAPLVSSTRNYPSCGLLYDIYFLYRFVMH